jgi:hypothetical protein
LALVLSTCIGLAACDDSSEPAALRDTEQRLVDAYVRLSVLEVLHRDHADSVETLLQNGVVFIDTLAVLRAADSLSAEPLRWEFVFDAITKRLAELEQTPDEWWNVVRGDSDRTTP